MINYHSGDDAARFVEVRYRAMGSSYDTTRQLLFVQDGPDHEIEVTMSENQPSAYPQTSRRHNHHVKIRQLWEAGELPRDGTSYVDTLHDHWCGIFLGAHCNCDPDIIVRDAIAHVRH
jgi:hypothetical protein